MLAMAEILVLVLITLVCVWRLRQSAMYRNRRRWVGGVPGQFTRPTPTFHGQRTNVPPPRPELLRDDDSVPSPSQHWWSRSKQPRPNGWDKKACRCPCCGWAD